MRQRFHELALLLIMFISTSSYAEQPDKCSDLFENFCHTLWSKEHLGNITIELSDKAYLLRFGKTEGDIDQARYFYYKSIQENSDKYSTEIKTALNKMKIFEKINAVLKRPPASSISPKDIWSPEWSSNIVQDIGEALEKAAKLRTEKEFPGFIRLNKWSTSPEMSQAQQKNIELLQSDFFITTWKDNGNLAEARKLFEIVRNEYLSWVTETKLIPENHKPEMINDLRSLRLNIPGSNPARLSDNEYLTCAIDERNAYYSRYFHDITLCAGEFNSHSSLLTLAHEIGHAIGIGRRNFNYRRNSLYGTQLVGLRERTCRGESLSCSEWEIFKKNHKQYASQLPPYNYLDKSYLDNFISKKLEKISDRDKLELLATRRSQKTLRSLIDNGDLASILKKTTYLADGNIVPNYKYMNACRATRWPQDIDLLSNQANQFMTFFTQEFQCQLGNKKPELEALKLSIEESLGLIGPSWILEITSPGKYSSLPEAVEENFSQHIEEDVVDNYASLVGARILKKMPLLEDRRRLFFIAAASRCDRPSFRQTFPKETAILKSYSNQPHSIGLDRRLKILTTEIAEALDCR